MGESNNLQSNSKFNGENQIDRKGKGAAELNLPDITVNVTD